MKKKSEDETDEPSSKRRKLENDVKNQPKKLEEDDNDEEEEDEEDEEGEEDEEEESDESNSNVSQASWGTNHLIKNVPQNRTRKHIQKEEISSDAEGFFDNPLWLESDSDRSFELESSAEQRALQESVDSYWQSDYTASEDTESTKSKKQTKPQRKRINRVSVIHRLSLNFPRPYDPDSRNRVNDHEESIIHTIKISTFLELLNKGDLKLGSPTAPWRTNETALSGRPFVKYVKKGSACYKAGFQVGGIITSIGDIPVNWCAEVREILEEMCKKSGEEEVKVVTSSCLELDSEESSVESSSSEESESEENDLLKGKGKGNGKGKGKNSFLTSCTKPAVKRSGRGIYPTYKQSEKYHQNRLEDSKKLAEETKDQLAEILDKVRKEEARRAEQMQALRAKHRLKGDLVSTLQSVSKPTTNISFLGAPCHSYDFPPFPRFIGIDKKENGRYKITYCLSPMFDPITCLGFKTADDFKKLRHAAAVAASWLAEGDSHHTKNVLQEGLSAFDTKRIANIIRGNYSKEAWEERLKAFTRDAFFSMFGELPDEYKQGKKRKRKIKQ